jgi:hypothetical protein
MLHTLRFFPLSSKCRLFHNATFFGSYINSHFTYRVCENLNAKFRCQKVKYAVTSLKYRLPTWRLRCNTTQRLWHPTHSVWCEQVDSASDPYRPESKGDRKKWPPTLAVTSRRRCGHWVYWCRGRDFRLMLMLVMTSEFWSSGFLSSQLALIPHY